MSFKNFSIWRGRLPHWRADDVRYFVTFKYRRAFDDRERRILMAQLMRTQGRKFDLEILAVGPEYAELIFQVPTGPQGVSVELSKVIENCKTKSGKLILKQTGERFSPFYQESYDHIIRDESEFEALWQQTFDLGCLDDTDEFLWARESD